MENNEKIVKILSELDEVIIGQRNLKRDILISLLAGGHILLEWAPWLGKTLTVKTFAATVNLAFSRIQFTPDLLPSDLIGAKIYNQESKSFDVKQGPIFADFVLADEINRAPSKVQSALLEAMEEKQVTIGEETFSLGKNFMVLATQNPIEQEGTYHLPEAQLDRFLLKTLIDYPTAEEELQIMNGQSARTSQKVSKVCGVRDLAQMKKDVEQIQVSESIYTYVRDIVFATREESDISKYISYGVSPRASLALIQCSKALAYISGRNFVTPEDIKEMAYPVLRHRIILSYDALADDISVEDIITTILSKVEIL